MIDLIRSMFSTPEAQADAYTWAAVLLAHAMIGAMLTAILAALNGDRGWRAAAIVSTLYGLIWEGGQLLLAGAGVEIESFDNSSIRKLGWAQWRS